MQTAIKQLVRKSYRGIPHQNEASIIVAEYNSRKALAKLGYTTPLEELDCFTADCFAVIENELAKIQDEEIKKAGRKKK